MANNTALERQLSGRRGLRNAGQVVDKTSKFGVADSRAQTQRVQTGEVNQDRKVAALSGAIDVATRWERTEETVSDEARGLRLGDRQFLTRLFHRHAASSK